MAQPKTPITELDFDGIKTQLKEFLQNQTQFKDYNFEGSNLNVVLDVLAYNSFQNNFYTNMAINEMFLDTAQLKNSLSSHAKELNYLPRSRKSARAVVKLTVTTQQGDTNQTVIIPQYSEFTTTFGGQNFTFATNETYIARKISNGVYVTDEIVILEGAVLTSFEREGFIVDAEGFLQVALTNENVDTDSLVVFVDAEQTEDQNIYTFTKSIFGIGPEDKVFYVEPFFDDRYSIYFGHDVFGQQPTEAEDVRVQYRITSGVEANGATGFVASFIEGASISVETITKALGGAERESVESIRFFAPKSIQIQERAITTSDYEVLLKQQFPEITAVSAYGGDELDPPQFGKVAISVFLQDDAQLVSATLANSYIEYLDSRSPLSIEPIFVSTKFLYADLTVNVSTTSKLATKSLDEIESLVRAKIKSFSNTSLEDFNKTLRLSKLSSNIDTIDSAINSNDITAKPIIEYSPPLRITTNPTFKFSAELITPYAYRDTSGFMNFKPAIKSSLFDIAGVCVFIQDDGLGNIQLVTDDLVNQTIIDPTAGTVDYKTGEVKLVNFKVDSFVGSAIKIIATTLGNDLKSPKGRVFIIRDDDVKVNVTVEERFVGGNTSSVNNFR
jgi:hypothetical protein